MNDRQLLPRFRGCLLASAFLTVAVFTASAQEGYEMPPASVGVIQLQGRAMPVMSELPGRVAATRISEVRARVSGILQERVFQQGTLVNEGDVLFKIDPRLFHVRVASAEAALQRAKATHANARVQLERQKTLREKNISSGVDYDTAAVAVAQADADVASAEAALDEAKINLEYTEVRAPITGVIGAALATEGALVTADGTQSLALIQQIDPVYVDFTQSAQELLALKRAVSEGALASPAPGEAKVELVFDDGSLYPASGSLLFASANVDATTGQVTLRAEFPNPDGNLLPGMYVRVHIEQAVRQGAIVVPQRAVTRTQDGKPQVYVVGQDGTAEARDVQLGQAQGNEWVVESGLKEGETAIVDGVQKVQPGAKVAAEPWTPESGEAAATQDQAPDQQAK
ncbi:MULTISPECIES: efflux RND transporter periplasmic adaptor subunit [Brucella]|uniref:Efflux RND transporter periplasmic adaptor subunit n=1 Tax=Brucella pseudogrignonensis TaxID=419475 RepID=A0A7Y3T1R1_9HYPH|nr:efflux RND transporter periplasmic adaptor subunit [Brucella pseudogrignonensis]NNV19096.1 efflux RND transporter periplasmic adaptor subunit [Brucella pseudogrignonensis]